MDSWCPLSKICDYTLLEIAKFLPSRDVLSFRLCASAFHRILTPYLKRTRLFTAFDPHVASRLSLLGYHVQFFDSWVVFSNEGLKSLQSIDHLHFINKNHQITSLESLSHVRTLTFKAHRRIKHFGNFPNLKDISLYDVDIKDLESFKNAEIVRLYQCEKLKSVRAIATAKTVKIDDCHGFRYGFPIDLSPLNRIQKLTLCNLPWLHDLTWLTDVVAVTISGCLNLSALGTLDNVQKLVIKDSRLSELPADTIVTVPQVKIIQVFDLETANAFALVKSLTIEDCDALKDVSCLANVSKLVLEDCRSITDISALRNVPHLTVRFCENITIR
jgi:Leucine-rich repeat (LRR) protein